MPEVSNTTPTGSVQITGNLVVGQPLTADSSALADADGIATAFSYQWLRDGSQIDGANSDSYTLTSADQGAAISVTVSYQDSLSNSETVSSTQTSAVQGLSPVNQAPIASADAASVRADASATATGNLLLNDSDAENATLSVAEVNGQAVVGSGRGTGGFSDGVTGSTSLSIYLYDGTGFQWDVYGDGQIDDGNSDAYDGGLYLNGFPYFYSAATEESGREIVIGAATMNASGGTVEVTRKVYVPADQGYARFLEVVHNPGSETVRFTVPIYTDLGSDGSEGFVASSSGDASVDANDRWVVTDDVNDGWDPAVTHVVAGQSAAAGPTSFGYSSGSISYSYDLTLAPGQTQIVMHFASQSHNETTAVERAQSLSELQLNALQGMSAEERAQVVNFDLGGVVVDGQYGKLTLGADGRYVYTPDSRAVVLSAGETATETFNYTVSDGQGGLTQSQLSVTVEGINDAPKLSLSANQIIENVEVGAGVHVGDVAVNDPDASGNANVLTLSGYDAGSFELREGNQLWYTGRSPDYESRSSYNLTVTSTDGAVVSHADLTVQVQNANDSVQGSLVINGAPVAGTVLNLQSSLWDQDGLQQVSYTWYSRETIDGSVVETELAQGDRYTLTAGMVGKALFVKATLVDAFGSSEFLSAATAEILPEGRYQITGTADTDSLSGDNRNDDLYGLEGNDTLNGGAGSDSLDGGAGDDSLNSTGSNGNYHSNYTSQPMSSTLVGGDGNDSLSSSWQSQASLSGGADNDNLDVSYVRSATLEGGSGSDGLNVSYFAEYSFHTDGSRQAAESYHLDGGDGDDSLTVAGTSYNPEWYWDGSTGEATATLLGGAGNDRLEARDYNASSNNYYGMSAATLDGGEGDDTLTASGVLQATLTGGAGSDTFVLTGQQYLTQQSGAHQIAQADGTYKTVTPAPLLITDFQVGAGGDKLDLADLINYNWQTMSLQQSGLDTQLLIDGNVAVVLQGVVVSDLVLENFKSQYDVLHNRFVITGTPDSDNLYGGNRSEYISGLDGNDYIQGNAGSDYLDGGAGDDNLNSSGSNGNYYSSYTTQPMSSTLVGGDGNDSLSASWQSQASLSGGADNDSLSTSYVRSATLEGGAGSDNLNVYYHGYYSQYTDGNQQAPESYHLDGGDGDDSLTVGGYSTNYQSWWWGGEAYGEATATLLGGAGNDRLEAREYNASSNNYYGMSAASLDGGEGNDTLIASGVLQATLTGGAGSDTFALTWQQYQTQQSGAHQIALADGSYKTVTPVPLLITDFQAGVGGDKLDLSDLVNNLDWWSYTYYGRNPFTDGRLSLVQSGADTLLQVDGNVAAVLRGVVAANLRSDNFTANYELPQQFGFGNLDDTGALAADGITRDNSFELVARTPNADYGLVFEKSTDGGANWSVTNAQQSALADGHYEYRARMGGLKVDQQGAIHVEQTHEANGDVTLRFFADATLGNVTTLDFTVSYDAARATLRSATPGAGFDLGDANESAPGQVMVALASVEGYAAGGTTPLAELHLQLGVGVNSLDLGIGSVVVDEVARDGTQVRLEPEIVTAPIEITVDTLAPVISSAAEVSLQEGQNQLYDANASEDNVTWGLSGADANLLQIDARGVVTLREGVLDTDGASAKASYEFNVVATDLAGNESLQGVRVAVQNLDDTLHGMVYQWKTHALLPDVNLALSTPQPTGATAVDGAGYELRNVSIDALGQVSADVWVDTEASVGSLDLAFGFGADAKASLVLNRDLQNWAVTVDDQTAGSLRVSGLTLDPASGAFQLGRLTLDLPQDQSKAQLQVSGLLDGQAVQGYEAVLGYDLQPLANGSTAGNGQYGLTGLTGGLLAVQASKSLGAGEIGGAINSADALAALKLAVGKGLYADPDGDGPLQAQTASPYQYIAADVNDDGAVTAADALAILKMAVKRGDAVPREWLFVSEQADFWDQSANDGAGAYTVDAGHVKWENEGLLISGREDLNLVAVLKGDVNGSWAAPEGSTVVADSHFTELVLNGVGTAGQWGLPTV